MDAVLVGTDGLSVDLVSFDCAGETVSFLVKLLHASPTDAMMDGQITSVSFEDALFTKSSPSLNLMRIRSRI